MDCLARAGASDEGCQCDACVDLMSKSRAPDKVDHDVLLEKRQEQRRKQHREAAKRYYQQHKADVLWNLNNKYRHDPEFREQVKRKNLARYHGKKMMMVGGAAVFVNE